MGQNAKADVPVVWVIDPLSTMQSKLRRIRARPNGGGITDQRRHGTTTCFVAVRSVPIPGTSDHRWIYELTAWAKERGCIFLESAWLEEGRKDLWESWCEYHERIRTGKIRQVQHVREVGGQKLTTYAPEPFPDDRMPAVLRKIRAGQHDGAIRAMTFPPPSEVEVEGETTDTAA